MDSCLIQDDVHQDIMNHVKQWIIDYDISVYNESTKRTFKTFSYSHRLLF